MTPGTLIFDREFKFYDGEDGQKILVVLGTAQGVTIVTKTTSRGKRFRNDFGCQINHRFPNFHLVHGCCCLSKATWICLDEFYEFKDSELLQRHFVATVNRIGELMRGITLQLSECALSSEDLTERQSAIITVALDAYRSSPNNKSDP